MPSGRIARPQQFLVRVRDVLAEKGVLAINVPPLKHKNNFV